MESAVYRNPWDTSGANAQLKSAQDVDLQQKKAIAMLCDGGATLPSTPSGGQWYRHTPTGRTILYQYDGSDWQTSAIQSFGAMTVYVDNTDGTDDMDYGGAVDAGAFKTIQYSYDAIPTNYSGHVIINVNGETYGEEVTARGKYATGAYTIKIVGTLTTQDTGTATGAAKYAKVGNVTHTKAYLDDTGKAWTVSAHQRRLLWIDGGTGSGQYRFIYDNTATRLSIVGDWVTQPDGTSTYKIVTFATVIDGGDTRDHCINAVGQKNLIVEAIRYIDATVDAFRIQAFSDVTINHCAYENTLNKATGTIMAINASDSLVDIEAFHSKCHASTWNGYSAIQFIAAAVAARPKGITHVWTEGGGFGCVIANQSFAYVSDSVFENHGLDGLRAQGGIIFLLEKTFTNFMGQIVTEGCQVGFMVMSKGHMFDFGRCEVRNSVSHGINIIGQSQFEVFRNWGGGAINDSTRIHGSGGWGVRTERGQSFGNVVSKQHYNANTSGTYSADATVYAVNT